MARNIRSVQHWLDWPNCHAGRPHLHALISVRPRFVLERIALCEHQLVVQIAERGQRNAGIVAVPV